MKKFLSLFLAVLLCVSALAGCGSDGESSEMEKTGPRFEKMDSKSVKYYWLNANNEVEYETYFFNENMGVPYLNLNDFADLMMYVVSLRDKNTGYQLGLTIEDSVVKMNRENSGFVSFDFLNNQMTFENYPDLISLKGYGSPFASIDNRQQEDSEPPLYLERVQEVNSYPGEEAVISLDDYDLFLYADGDDYFVPVKLVSDFLMQALSITLVYNGDAFFGIDLETPLEEQTKFLKKYYKHTDNSVLCEGMKDFNFKEMCCILDAFYGLKEEHGINRFNQYLTNNRRIDSFLASVPEASNALRKVIYEDLADLTSQFVAASCFKEESKEEKYVIGQAPVVLNYTNVYKEYAETYETMNPDGEFYEEIGNTAYLKMDDFQGITADDRNTSAESLGDTFGRVQYVHQQIYRPDSPVENVVIDLSLNQGGSIDGMAYMLSWILGDVQLSYVDSFSKATATETYRADVNLDGEFDQRDNISDKNVYCIVSPATFSLGNYAAAILQETGRGIVLGKPTAGGGSLPMTLSNAMGDLYRISGNIKMAIRKNGMYRFVDAGISPDYKLLSVSDFYDRDWLTAYISNLY